MTKKGEAITSLEKIFPEAADLPDALPLHSALSLLADYAKSTVFAEELEKRLQDNFGADADWKNLNEKDKLLFIERFIFDSKTGRWGKSPALIFAESAQGLSCRRRGERHHESGGCMRGDGRAHFSRPGRGGRVETARARGGVVAGRPRRRGHDGG